MCSFQIWKNYPEFIHTFFQGIDVFTFNKCEHDIIIRKGEKMATVLCHLKSPHLKIKDCSTPPPISEELINLCEEEHIIIKGGATFQEIDSDDEPLSSLKQRMREQSVVNVHVQYSDEPQDEIYNFNELIPFVVLNRL